MMMGMTMGTIWFAIHGNPDRYRTAIGNARTRSKIAKGLAIPVTMQIGIEVDVYFEGPRRGDVKHEHIRKEIEEREREEAQAIINKVGKGECDQAIFDEVSTAPVS
ncbi:hypothetical protein Tco_1375384 [Tanacetum coccineum]